MAIVKLRDRLSVDIRIQSATPADAQSILTLQHLAYRSEARLYDDWSIPPLTQTIGGLIAEFDSSRFLKALLGDDLVGSVRAKHTGNTCDIGRLIVHPDCQRLGIGRRLMHEIEAQFSSANRFELFTGLRSEGNIRLYESLGYRRFRLQEVSANLTLVYMEKLKSQF